MSNVHYENFLKEIANKISEKTNMEINDAVSLVEDIMEKLNDEMDLLKYKHLRKSYNYKLVMDTVRELGYDPDFPLEATDYVKYNIIGFPTQEQVITIKNDRIKEQIKKELIDYFNNI